MGRIVVSVAVLNPAKEGDAPLRIIGAEVLFLEMASADGQYEPLLGYLPLEACGAAVDMLGHRLVPVKYMDLKQGEAA